VAGLDVLYNVALTSGINAITDVTYNTCMTNENSFESGSNIAVQLQ